jgi:hypothetical protein
MQPDPIGLKDIKAADREKVDRAEKEAVMKKALSD